MDWKFWEDKQVFIRTKYGKYYTGTVKEVDVSSPPLIWITILDKFNENVQFVASEIIEIKEDKE